MKQRFIIINKITIPDCQQISSQHKSYRNTQQANSKKVQKGLAEPSN